MDTDAHVADIEPSQVVLDEPEPDWTAPSFDQPIDMVREVTRIHGANAASVRAGLPA